MKIDLSGYWDIKQQGSENDYEVFSIPLFQDGTNLIQSGGFNWLCRIVFIMKNDLSGYWDIKHQGSENDYEVFSNPLLQDGPNLFQSGDFNWLCRLIFKMKIN